MAKSNTGKPANKGSNKITANLNPPVLNPGNENIVPGPQTAMQAPVPLEPVTEIPPADYSSSMIKEQNPRFVYGLYMTEFSVLTSDQLKWYMEGKRRGLNFFHALLFEEIRRRDLRIGAECDKRKMNVYNKEYDVSFDEESPVPESLQNEIIEFIEDNLERLDVRLFCAACIEAQIQGIKAFELNYDVFGSKVGIKDLNIIPNHMLTYDDINHKYNFLNLMGIDVIRLRAVTWNIFKDRFDLSEYIIPNIPEEKILIVKGIQGESQNAFLNGLWDGLTWAFFFKNYGLKDWSVWLEQFSSPAKVITRPTIMGKTDINALEDLISAWEHLTRMVIPEGVKIELLESKNLTQAHEIFKGYIDSFWNKEISIRINGENLATEAGTSGGSHAAAKTHYQVSQDINVCDMLLCKAAVNKVIRRVLDMNYPDLADYPEFSFDEEEDITYKLTRSEIYKNLKFAGFQVDLEDAEREFDVTLTASETVTTRGTEEIYAGGGSPPANPKPGENKVPEIKPKPGEVPIAHEGMMEDWIDNFIEKFFEGVRK